MMECGMWSKRFDKWLCGSDRNAGRVIYAIGACPAPTCYVLLVKLIKLSCVQRPIFYNPFPASFSQRDYYVGKDSNQMSA